MHIEVQTELDPPQKAQSFLKKGIIAYGELYTGALKFTAPAKKLEQLAEFIQATALLYSDS